MSKINYIIIISLIISLGVCISSIIRNKKQVYNLYIYKGVDDIGEYTYASKEEPMYVCPCPEICSHTECKKGIWCNTSGEECILPISTLGIRCYSTLIENK